MISPQTTLINIVSQEVTHKMIFSENYETGIDSLLTCNKDIQ